MCQSIRFRTLVRLLARHGRHLLCGVPLERRLFGGGVGSPVQIGPGVSGSSQVIFLVFFMANGISFIELFSHSGQYRRGFGKPLGTDSNQGTSALWLRSHLPRTTPLKRITLIGQAQKGRARPAYS